jgi:hypothetical protein
MATPQEVEMAEPTETTELDEKDIAKWAGLPADDEPEAQDESPAAEPETATVQPTPSQAKPKEAKPKPVNLDDLDEFRKWKSESDKKHADLQRKLKEAEARAAQRDAEQQQYTLRSLQAQLTETDDDNQRAALIEQMAALRSQEYVSRERKWAEHVRTRAEEEGLDSTAFEPTRYRGEAGALEFERDVAAAAKDKLRKELQDAKKASSPEALAQIIRAEVAKALRTKGVDTAVETAAPGGAGPDEDATWARDFQQVQTGRMTETQFKKRHPG